jgi:asparagine synthetase B (glutamine-hydrolysing)
VQRDAFGQQPLHFSLREGHAAQSVWTLTPTGLAPAAVTAYLEGRLAAHASLFEGIGRVPPGHLLEGPQPRPWWRWPDRHAAAPEELLAALGAAVESFGPAAIALSGGLDSATLLGLAARRGLVASAFTVADDLDDGSELARARQSARHAGVPLIEVELPEADLPDLFPAAVLAAEEPIWNGRGVARLAFFRALRSAGVTLPVLSGVGADELLLGDLGGLRAGRRRQAREAALVHTLGLPGVAAEPLPIDLSRGAARRDAALRLLPESTLPPECRLSRDAGLVVALPFLADGPAALALGFPEDLLVRGELGKWPLREASAGLVAESLRLGAKVPRLVPPGGGSARARRRWLELLDAWLQPARLEPLAVAPDAVRAGLARLATEPDPGERAALDALLLRLAGLCVLDAACR